MSFALANSLNVRALYATWRRTHAPANTMNLTEELTLAESEFGIALARYKAETGRVNPQHSEVLTVLMALGYRQIAPGQAETTAAALAPALAPAPETAAVTRKGKAIPTATRAAGRSRAELARKVCTKCNRPLAVAAAGPSPTAAPAPMFPPFPVTGPAPARRA